MIVSQWDSKILKMSHINRRIVFQVTAWSLDASMYFRVITDRQLCDIRGGCALVCMKTSERERERVCVGGWGTTILLTPNRRDKDMLKLRTG